MMMKSRKPMKFSYKPRYKRDENGNIEKERRQIEFRRIARRKTSGRSFIWLVCLLIIVVFLINYLSNMARGG